MLRPQDTIFVDKNKQFIKDGMLQKSKTNRSICPFKVIDLQKQTSTI